MLNSHNTKQINILEKSRNLSHMFPYFLIFEFCSMTVRLMDKVNYILDAYWLMESSKKIQRSILNNRRENHNFPKIQQTERANQSLALLLKMMY